MYKAKTFDEIFSENKYLFNSDHIAIKNWIKAQEKDFRRALFKSHGYNRTVSMFDFDKLSQLEGFNAIDRLCIVSGAVDEPEINFVDVEEVFTTSLQDFVGKSALVKLIPGYFPESTESINPDNQYALVHLDADLYNPQISGLEYFYPRMTQGGVIIIHDCNNEFTGSKKALDEFFLDKPETPIIIPDKSGSAIVVKLKA